LEGDFRTFHSVFPHDAESPVPALHSLYPRCQTVTIMVQVDPRWTPYIGHAEDILADSDAATDGRRRANLRTSLAAEAALHAYGAAASIKMDS
jgi:hypothetical protein